jgi:hypothetical protein
MGVEPIRRAVGAKSMPTVMKAPALVGVRPHRQQSANVQAVVVRRAVRSGVGAKMEGGAY